MERLLDKIVFNYSDPEISKYLRAIDNRKTNYSVHFDQNEDAFLLSENTLKVPSFTVFHDVNKTKPSEDYINKLRQLVSSLCRAFPEVFVGTKYFFDPAEILRPCFIQVLKTDQNYYLYILRLDLNIRLLDSRITANATNDTTAEFETKKLFFESLIIPVFQPEIADSSGSIPLKRFFESTWVGESGTGYHVNGKWIDLELTKLLTAVFMADGVNSYPYYPFRCDFNTICLFPADISFSGRYKFIRYFHKSLHLIQNHIPKMEKEFKKRPFTRSNPLYLELKRTIPREWTKIWSSLKIKPYLNKEGMKEYKLEFNFQ